jgi:hypothetical protein
MSPLVPYTRKGASFFFPPEPGRANLLYAVGSTIRLHVEGKPKEYLIAERPGNVSALAMHNDCLVNAEKLQGTDSLGMSDIVRTETGETIAKRVGRTNALAVHEGELVDAGEPGMVRYTEREEVIAERPSSISTLTIDDGRLVDAGSYHRVFYTKEHELIAAHQDVYVLTFFDSDPMPLEYRLVGISALAVRNKILFSALNYLEGCNSRGVISRVKGDETIAERPQFIRALATYKGRLIDAGDYEEIRYSRLGETIVKAEDRIVALLPIDAKAAGRLLKLPGVEEIE